MKLALVIPARMASTRLPGKPLINIGGKSMIQRTYERCAQAFDSRDIYVATDSAEIVEHCVGLGIQAVMTSGDCLTGTDRVAEFATMVHADYYINVQGDEPIINPDDIRKIVNAISEARGGILNGYAPILEESEYRSRTIPKVVFRSDSRLLYMSRSPIPGNKTGGFNIGWKQVCIYAFPKKAIEDFAAQMHKSPLENEEDIEILRFLELGYEVQMIELSGKSIAVDTPEDVDKVINKLNEDG